MHPILFPTPFFTIYTFGVLLAAAYLSALWWVVRGARRQGLDADEFMSLGTWAIVGALLGAKALLMVRAAPTRPCSRARATSTAVSLAR